MWMNLKAYKVPWKQRVGPGLPLLLSVFSHAFHIQVGQISPGKGRALALVLVAGIPAVRPYLTLLSLFPGI